MAETDALSPRPRRVPRLFRAALRAPEEVLASEEFVGKFTDGTMFIASFYAFFVQTVPVFAIGIALWTSGNPLAKAVSIYTAISYYFGCWFSGGVAFDRRRIWLFAPAAAYKAALPLRTAVRLANVYFARFLRRLVFPWEWVHGRP